MESGVNVVSISVLTVWLVLLGQLSHQIGELLVMYHVTAVIKI